MKGFSYVKYKYAVLSQRFRIICRSFRHPLEFLGVLGKAPFTATGFSFAKRWETEPARRAAAEVKGPAPVAGENPLWDYFDAHRTGKIICKWRHYFDIYHRHFAQFRGREVRILEIGVACGGSLEMWRNYFGEKCTVVGMDIDERCKAFEKDGFRIFIGDQTNRAFWRHLKEQVPMFDIIIDDGGHKAEQQVVTLEELLPYLRPGGVYLCEDVHHAHQGFAAYIGGLGDHFNLTDIIRGKDLTARPSAFQQDIAAIHRYPFVVVLQKTTEPSPLFCSYYRGTDYLPEP